MTWLIRLLTGRRLSRDLERNRQAADALDLAVKKVLNR
ncbi:hypothetical protein PARPLA_02820 [Rhodobacteraceae bacterium THAF1]|nr:hypothetical protein FIU81_06010 [Palleronia sp. THAF1]VDC28777.1 hypothetical protein PARPLA_02820 [Rhodobacteraceae bacterium THAF1]